MARGRKKLKIRDFRVEKIRPSEAAKFLNINESYFYQLVREGYIKKHEKGVYYLGEILLAYLWACSDKKYSISDFLLALSEWRIQDKKNAEEIEQVEWEKEQVKQIQAEKIRAL